MGRLHFERLCIYSYATAFAVCRIVFAVQPLQHQSLYLCDNIIMEWSLFTGNLSAMVYKRNNCFLLCGLHFLSDG